MLTRCVLAVTVSIVVAAAVVPAAWANTEKAPCDSHDPYCVDVVITSSDQTGNGGQGGVGRPDPCTYTYDHQDPNGGTWYIKYCPPPPQLAPQDKAIWGNGWLVLLQDPPRPEQVAREALAKITLLGVTIGMAPQPGTGAGLVGLPVYLWARKSAATWGPLMASDTDQGLKADITARAVQVAWSMGDGHTVVCVDRGGDFVGTPYDPSYGANPSPDCGYRYGAPSRGQPGGRYQVQAVSTWEVDWVAGASNGKFLVTRTSDTSVTIDELQVVVR
jgi:hypothetical protein